MKCSSIVIVIVLVGSVIGWRLWDYYHRVMVQDLTECRYSEAGYYQYWVDHH